MKLNLDVVPRDLTHAVQILKNSIETPSDKKVLKKNNNLHHGLGRDIRNNWSLWERETHLVQWFINNLGISHADDISGTILEALACDLKDEKFDAKEHVKQYINHWKNLKIDPLTGETVK